jgi:hypothetical protein
LAWTFSRATADGAERTFSANVRGGEENAAAEARVAVARELRLRPA